MKKLGNTQSVTLEKPSGMVSIILFYILYYYLRGNRKSYRKICCQKEIIIIILYFLSIFEKLFVCLCMCVKVRSQTIEKLAIENRRKSIYLENEYAFEMLK
jgi:hypothetical protein